MRKKDMDNEVAKLIRENHPDVKIVNHRNGTFSVFAPPAMVEKYRDILSNHTPETFIEAVLQASCDEELQEICDRQMDFYKRRHTLKTRRTYVSEIRNRLRRINPYHLALEFFNISKEDTDTYNDEYRETVLAKSQPENFQEFDLKKYIEISEMLLTDYLKGQHTSYIKAGIGIAALTGRRFFSEVLFSAKFEAIDDRTLLFSGQAKKKGGENVPYEIPCLINTEILIKAWRKLRKEKSFLRDVDPEIIRKIARSNRISHERHNENIKNGQIELFDFQKRIKMAARKDASVEVKKIFSGIKEKIQVRDLRNLYAEACCTTFYTRAIHGDRREYIERILGHREGSGMGKVYDVATSR